HRLELAAVDRDRVTVEQMHAPAECDEAGADLADGWAIVAAEIGNRLEVRRQLSDEPHHLDVALALALQPARRLDLVEIAIQINLEQRCWVIAGSASRLRLNVEADLRQIESIDEGIHHPHWIIGFDRLVEPLGKKRRLIAVPPLDESRHASPRSQLRNHTMLRNARGRPSVFSHGLVYSRVDGLEDDALERSPKAVDGRSGLKPAIRRQTRCAMSYR